MGQREETRKREGNRVKPGHRDTGGPVLRAALCSPAPCVFPVLKCYLGPGKLQYKHGTQIDENKHGHLCFILFLFILMRKKGKMAMKQFQDKLVGWL